MTPSLPRALFLGSGFAGHRAWFATLQREVERDGRLDARFELVSGWRSGARLESLEWVPRVVRSRARVLRETASIAAFPRPDVIWTSAPPPALVPFLGSQLGPWRRPLVVQLDWTREQQEEMAPFYYARPPRSGTVTRIGTRLDQLVYMRAAAVAPWSKWAAASLQRAGMPAERIRVLPPGVDLENWTPSNERWNARDGKLRLLLVGGDFVRKGGELLLEAMRAGLAEQCELDIVTRDEVPATEGVRVHRAEPGSSLLPELYARAHLFVMPSLAECFGIATIEAMASGLPVLVSDVGASAEIIDDGASGWLTPPTVNAVLTGVRNALLRRDALPAMGARGRQIATERFDARKNARAVVNLLLEVSRH